MSPLTRDGHLLDLGVDLYLTGDLDEQGRAAVDEHLAGCAACARRLALAREVHALPLPPLRLAAPALARTPAANAAPRVRSWGGPLGLVAAMAAALLLWVFPDPPSDGFVRRGGPAPLLEVFRDAPQGAERLEDGALVAAGDRLGFRVLAPEGGWTLIFGLDARGEPWTAWPQGEAPAAARLEASPEPVQVPAAVVLDDAQGDEQVLAIRCPTPFSWAQATGWAQTGAPEGCALARVTLHREP